MHAYVELHRRGHAHSVEVYEGDELVGGLYGVTFGAFFGGESMFHRRTDASKAAVGLPGRAPARARLPPAGRPGAQPASDQPGRGRDPAPRVPGAAAPALAIAGHVLTTGPPGAAVCPRACYVPSSLPMPVLRCAVPCRSVVAVWLRWRPAPTTDAPRQAGRPARVEDLRARVLRTSAPRPQRLHPGAGVLRGQAVREHRAGRALVAAAGGSRTAARVEAERRRSSRRSSARGWPGWATSWSSSPGRTARPSSGAVGASGRCASTATRARAGACATTASAW